MSSDIFYSLECLTEVSKALKAIELQKKWFRHSDKRYLAQTLQKLIVYNKNSFDYLNVTPNITGFDRELKLQFRSENFIGAVPIKSPENGKPIGDFLVYPRFGNAKDKFVEYTELIPLVGNSISPDFNNDMELFSNLNFKPPLYLESIKFIDLLFELTKNSWRKFKNESVISATYKGNINWDKLIEKDFSPERKFQIPTSINMLTQNHLDYSNVKYVFCLAKLDLLSDATPNTIRDKILDKLAILDIKLRDVNEIKTNYLTIIKSDFALIQKIKLQGNIILKNNFTLQKAWRIDYSTVFEKIVQYLFNEVSNVIGGNIFSNYRIPQKSHSTNLWELKYLEPDAIYYKDTEVFFVDAKYKSHLLNKYSESEFLKEEFRNDLHQILAYTSFSNSDNKVSFLCYPSATHNFSVNRFLSPINKSEVKIVMLGIPLNKSFFPKVKETIKAFILRKESSLLHRIL